MATADGGVRSILRVVVVLVVVPLASVAEQVAVCAVVSLTRCTGGQSTVSGGEMFVSDQLIQTSLTYQPGVSEVPKADHRHVNSAGRSSADARARPRPAAAPASPHHPPALDARGEGQERRARQREDQQRQRADGELARPAGVGGARGCAQLRERQVREPRQRDVRRGLLRDGPASRWCEVARRVVARRAGLLAAGFGVAVAAGAEGLAVVVVTVAEGRGAARTTTRGLVFTGAGSGRGALDPLGAASGLAGSCAPAGTAVASDAAATIATQRKCALAPMSTNRTLGRIDRTPGCPDLQPPTHPFGWVSGRWPAGRPTQNRPTGPCRAVSPPSSRGPARASPSGSPVSPPDPWVATWHVELRLPAADSAREALACRTEPPPPMLYSAPARWRCSGRTAERWRPNERPGRSRPSGPAPGRSRHSTRRPDRPTGWSGCRCRPRTSPPTR